MTAHFKFANNSHSHYQFHIVDCLIVVMLGIFRKVRVGESVVLGVIYTVGHILIAAACSHLITGAPPDLATIDAIVEPCINGIWFIFLYNLYQRYKVRRG